MQPDLNCISAFAQVASAGSFRKAAKALNIPLSTLSNRVARLEESMGVMLLNRTTRVVCLTDIGQSYLSSVTPALDALANAAKIAQDNPDGPTGSLKLSAPIEFGVRYLGDAIAKFKLLCPMVEIDCQLMNRRVSVIEEGFDMVIRAGKLEDSSLVCKAIGESQGMITCASPQYLLEHAPLVKPSDVASHTCLLMSDTRKPGNWHYQVNGKRKQIRVESSVFVNSYAILLELAIAHMGLINIPGFLAEEAIRANKLQAVLSEFSTPAIKFHALYPESSRLSPKVRLFLQTVETSLRG